MGENNDIKINTSDMHWLFATLNSKASHIPLIHLPKTICWTEDLMRSSVNATHKMKGKSSRRFHKTLRHGVSPLAQQLRRKLHH